MIWCENRCNTIATQAALFSFQWVFAPSFLVRTMSFLATVNTKSKTLAYMACLWFKLLCPLWLCAAFPKQLWRNSFTCGAHFFRTSLINNCPVYLALYIAHLFNLKPKHENVASVFYFPKLKNIKLKLHTFVSQSFAQTPLFLFACLFVCYFGGACFLHHFVFMIVWAGAAKLPKGKKIIPIFFCVHSKTSPQFRRP